MWINDAPLSDYGGELRMEYKASGYTLETSVFKGRKRSSFVLLNNIVGFQTLTLSVVFEGKDRDDVTLKKSMFDMLAFGKNELIMDDGFLYTVYLSNIGDATYPAPELIEVDYTFVGVRHGPKVVAVGNTINCESTLPNTDCILSVTVGKTEVNYRVGTVMFPQVTQGEQLTVDGINKRILVNNVPAADRADWITFPSLVPGINLLQCDDILTVEFFPVFF